MRVFQTWKLGREGVNDGALFVVARQERRMRIEVGYGLEDRLTDARSRQILDDIVRPHFRDGNFGAGIEAGVDAIAAVVEGASLPAAPTGPIPAVRLRSSGSSCSRGIFLLVIGTFSLVALLAPGGVGWFLYLFLVPFYAAFPTAMLPALRRRHRGGGLAHPVPDRPHASCTPRKARSSASGAAGHADPG